MLDTCKPFEILFFKDDRGLLIVIPVPHEKLIASGKARVAREKDRVPVMNLFTPGRERDLAVLRDPR